ncbi:MAG: amidohydrolase [Synergistaceae bacterium]|nr:amidohydrolase [Synergistaceae bacterium]
MIDFHVHVYPPEIIQNSELISKSEPYFNALTHNKVHRWATVDELLSAMTENGVERSVIFGFAFQDLELCRICNDYVISAVKNYPERLSGFCVVPPSVHASAHASTRGFEAEIIRCAEQGLIGVGELFPEGQGFDITDKRETQSLAGILEELGMPLLLHTAEPVGHDYVGKGNIGPKEAAVFCSNNPELKVIFAHLGGGLWLYDLMPEMKEILANAYYDLAALPWLYKPEILTAIKGAGLIEKFLFGSDFPILNPQRYKKIFTDSVASRLSAADIEAITRRNARKVLKLFSQK